MIPHVSVGERLSASKQNVLIDKVNEVANQAYIHNQNTASTVWVIPHGLPFEPNVEVVDHIGSPHYPLISWPSPGTVQLNFDAPVSGTARLS